MKRKGGVVRKTTEHYKKSTKQPPLSKHVILLGVLIILLLLVFTLKLIGKLDTVVRKGARELDFYIEFFDNKGLLMFCDKIKADGHRIVKMQIGKCDGENDFPNALFSIRTKDKDHVAKLAVEMRRLKYVKSVEEL